MELQNTREELAELGFRIIAIAPDLPDNLRKMQKRLELDFDLFNDPGMEATAGFGVAFEVTNPEYAGLLEKSSGQDHHRLPAPAVFLVDRRGRVQFSYVNPEYKVRPSADLVVAAARFVTR